jgi:DNA-binding response OmpR family regulator
MENAIRILVIDDNPMIRDLIRRGLESFGDVHLAADGIEALNRLDEAAPDLVIVDAELGLNGDQSLPRELRRRIAAPLILLSARDPSGESHRFSDDGIDEVIEKPFLVRDLQSRVRRIVERIKLTRFVGGDSVRGTLAQMSVTDLVQSLEMGRKSCCLVLTGALATTSKTRLNPSSGTQQHCEMYFLEGRLVHAACGWLLGDEAVYDALRWEGGGAFEIDFKATTDLRTTTRSTQALLLEGMRLLDEANRSACAGECEDDHGESGGKGAE